MLDQIRSCESVKAVVDPKEERHRVISIFEGQMMDQTKVDQCKLPVLCPKEVSRMEIRVADAAQEDHAIDQVIDAACELARRNGQFLEIVGSDSFDELHDHGISAAVLGIDFRDDDVRFVAKHLGELFDVFGLAREVGLGKQ